MIPYWVALILLVQHRDAAVPQKQLAALVAQIRRLAASEPVVFGIDTRLLTAEVLTSKYPKIAKDLLRDSASAAGGIATPAEQDRIRVRIVDRMAPLDLEEAERLIGSIHRGGDQDYVAQAYDELVTFLARNHRDARNMISKGLQAGGFRSASAAKTLEDSLAADPSGATALFAEILGAFPAQSPGERDVYYLLECTKKIAGLNRALAVEAIDKALGAANSEKLQISAGEKEKDEKALRQKLLREIAAILGSIDPDLLRRYKSEHQELDASMAAVDSPQPEESQKHDMDLPDLSALPYSEALSQARKQEDPGVRAALLIDISRREGISSDQRAAVASEALASASAMPISNSRLLILAMISRDFARNNEPANAAFAAELLSEAYSKACACEQATCDGDGETFDCLEMVEDFAKYLDEFKITPESMNLNNISLEARLLILKLYPLLGQKAPSQWLSGN